MEPSSLNKALRAAVVGRKSTLLTSEDGRRFRVKLGYYKGGRATIQFKRRGFAFDEADLLSGDLKTRTSALRRVFETKPLTRDEEDKWKTIARQRAFTDREYLDVMTALAATPEALLAQLRTLGRLDVGTIMPDEPSYYDRLLAPLGDSEHLLGYISNELAENRRLQLKRHSKQALRRIAYSALWQPLIPFELLASLRISDISPLLDAEDPFSILFCFELCCKLLPTDGGFVELGKSLLEKLLDPEAGTRRCNVFSALALISATNLRRAAKASKAPLYWSRLAALTHAGVLTDALGDRADAEDFFRWSADNFYPTYSWQGMIDRREAPRWDPDWISPAHVYSELYGRTRIALDTLPEGDRPAQWISASEVALTRLRDSGRILDSVLPGPFDDFHEDPNISPVLMQIFEVTESKLDDATYLNDVPGIVAFAYSNKLTSSALDNVARILNRRVDEPITNDGQDITYLHLCAHISGAARSETVAASVINRSLYAARNSGSRERVADLFAIIVEACAAHRDPHKYRELLGTTAAQLCFAVDNSRHLSLLEAAFDALTVRDEKLSPPIGKARAIARTRLKAS